MPYKDPIIARQKANERSGRYRQRQRIINPRPAHGKHGNHARGEKNGRWNSSRLISSHGYILLRCPNDPCAFGQGYRYEHDVVMERRLGRPLNHGEIVHHKNRIKTDNDPDNLEVITPSDHMTLHNRDRERDEDGRFKPEWPSDLRVREFPTVK